MKVAYITPSLEKCGPNVVLHNTVQGMLENDVECEVFYFNKSDKELKFECPTKKITDYTSLYRSLKSFDVVHSNGFKADFVLLLLKTFTPLDSKIVTTIHNNVYHDLYYGKGLFFSLFIGTLWSLIFCFFDVRTFLSKNALSYYWYLPFKSKNHVVYNSISSRDLVEEQVKIRKLFKIPADSIVIGACANINKRKGLDKIINNMVPEDDIYFIIVGDGTHKSKLEELVIKRGLTKKVKFHPFVKEPLDFISQFDVFAMPSLNEGFGLTIIESISVGTPVICSKLDVFQELFSGMVVFIPDTDKFKLNEVVQKTLSQKDELISKGQRSIRENYSIPIMSKALLNIYRLVKK